MDIFCAVGTVEQAEQPNYLAEVGTVEQAKQPNYLAEGQTPLGPTCHHPFESMPKVTVLKKGLSYPGGTVPRLPVQCLYRFGTVEQTEQPNYLAEGQTPL
eukprot:1160908-Pelagomonas_calceolata.AAC.14